MTSSTFDRERMRVIEGIFECMRLMYGKRFYDCWGTIDPQKLQNHWMDGLQEYSLNELKRGIDALKSVDWPPTLPEFKKLCRRPVNALEAYHEALIGLQARMQLKPFAWSHPAIFWAASRLSYDLMTQTHSVMRTRWESELNRELAKNCWEEIPEPTYLLQCTKRRTEASQAKSFLSRAKEILNKGRHGESAD